MDLRAVGREAVKVYRGWHALEQRLPSKVEIIDFDLIPDRVESTPFDSRQDVLAAIRKLRDGVTDTGEAGEFIRAKLNASCYYLRRLEGERFEFYHEVRNMVGKTPELVADEQVTQQERLVYRLLGEMGVPLRDGVPSTEAFQDFDASIRITADQAEAQAAALANRLVPIVLDILDLADLAVRYRFEIVKKEEYWSAWADGQPGDLRLQFNFHHQRPWRMGDIEYLVIHEVCGHFVHAESLAREIQQERLNPFIGLTTVHNPSTFMAEGIADALTFLLPDDIQLSPPAVLSREQRRWREYLSNNAHVMVNMG